MIKLPKPIFGGNCIQPIVWLGTPLNATSPVSVMFIYYQYPHMVLQRLSHGTISTGCLHCRAPGTQDWSLDRVLRGGLLQVGPQVGLPLHHPGLHLAGHPTVPSLRRCWLHWSPAVATATLCEYPYSFSSQSTSHIAITLLRLVNFTGCSCCEYNLSRDRRLAFVPGCKGVCDHCCHVAGLVYP